MADAMNDVRLHMGDDAIIVSSLKVLEGIEVTAAVENSRPQKHKSAPEVEDALENLLQARLRIGKLAIPSAKKEKSSPPSKSDLPVIPFDTDKIRKALKNHDLPDELRDRLLATAQKIDTDNALTALTTALEACLTFEPLPLAPAHPIMLVGLPGSGKTVTMAKLAARALLEGYETALLTTDTNRTGASAQSDAYGDLLEQPITHVENPDELTCHLDRHIEAAHLDPATATPCFIDTASLNPFDREELEALHQLTKAARHVARAEPVLTIAAGGHIGAMCEAAGAFAHLGVRRLIVTQLDIARRLGPVLSVADRTGLSLAQMSVTPYLANGLAKLTATSCARLLLADLEPAGDQASPALKQAAHA